MSRMIKIRDTFSYDTMKMALTQNEDVIQTLASHTAHEPLADGVGSRCFHRGLEHLHLTILGHAGETPPILVVIVSDQKAWTLSLGRGFPDLLRDPSITR
jgi:hypothetical protein